MTSHYKRMIGVVRYVYLVAGAVTLSQKWNEFSSLKLHRGLHYFRHLERLRRHIRKTFLLNIMASLCFVHRYMRFTATSPTRLCVGLHG